MSLEEVLSNLRDANDRYNNLPLLNEVEPLCYILRDLGCNLTALVEIRKEYYLKFQSIIYNSKASSNAAKTKEAEFRVPELDHIRKVLAQFTELRKDVRSQISYWKTQEKSL